MVWLSLISKSDVPLKLKKALLHGYNGSFYNKDGSDKEQGTGLRLKRGESKMKRSLGCDSGGTNSVRKQKVDLI